MTKTRNMIKLKVDSKHIITEVMRFDNFILRNSMF